jgi:hypothetical protein
VLGAVVAVALVVVSGGSDADPRTPVGLPGLPPPFLGTAVAGDGGLTAAVDSYGDVVDLRAPGPAGRALIDNPSDRQAAGTVPAATGIVPRVSVDGGPALPLWRADSVSQRYLPGTNVVRTRARFGQVQMAVDAAVGNRRLALIAKAAGRAGEDVAPAVSVNVGDEAACRSTAHGDSLALLCMQSKVPLSRRFLESQPSGVRIFYRRGGDPFLAAARAIVSRAAASDRAWLASSTPLGGGAPAWARRMYARSLLTLRALTDRRTGAVAAGTRDGWAYVWPRDTATACLAFAAAGHRGEARKIAHYLGRLDLAAAARFGEDGDPIPDRGPQGDAAGWTTACANAVGLRPNDDPPYPWRARSDYQESPPGNYLANAITATAAAAAAAEADGTKSRPYDDKSARRHQGEAIGGEFGTPQGLVRRTGDPASGLDSAAAWAVRPFPLPSLYPEVRRTLLRLVATGGRFGITPGEGWTGGVDPWTAPTAWSAWSFAALADAQRRDPAAARTDRRQSLRLLADLRRAATPAGALPERVDAATGIASSTTPLAWSHAFAILALLQLRPGASG